MTPPSKLAPYQLNCLFLALVRATARPVACQAPSRNLLDLIQTCLLVQRNGGDSNAIRRAAYRIGLRLSPEHRQTAALVINSVDPLDLIIKFEEKYMEW